MIGTAAGVANNIEEWFAGDAADGFNIMPQALLGSLADVVELVVPELQRRGLFRTAYKGRTLRQKLGLHWPQTRHAAARADAGARADVAE